MGLGGEKIKEAVSINHMEIICEILADRIARQNQVIAEQRRKLEKAEHDRNRYAKRIEHLQNELSGLYADMVACMDCKYWEGEPYRDLGYCNKFQTNVDPGYCCIDGRQKDSPE